MVTLSTAAEDRLRSLLSSTSVGPEAVVRVRREEEGWALRLDQEHPEDETVERKGRTLLVADEETSEALSGVVLDVREEADRSEFVLIDLEAQPNG